MKKPVKFKPSSPALKKDMAAAKRALNAWHKVSGVGEPVALRSGVPYSAAAQKAIKRYDELVEYAAALGRKQGLLPANMTGWGGSAAWSGGEGIVRFAEIGEGKEPVKIAVRFLDWVPAPAVEEVDEALQVAA